MSCFLPGNSGISYPSPPLSFLFEKVYSCICVSAMGKDPLLNPKRPYLNPRDWRITYLPDDDSVIDLDR